MTYSGPNGGPPASLQAKRHINEGLLQAPVILSCVSSGGPGMKLYPRLQRQVMERIKG